MAQPDGVVMLHCFGRLAKLECGAEAAAHQLGWCVIEVS